MQAAKSRWSVVGGRGAVCKPIYSLLGLLGEPAAGRQSRLSARRFRSIPVQDILGDAYAHDVRRNWQMVYTFMSALMLEGFRKAKQSEASSPSSTSSGGFLEAPRLADAVPAVAGVVA